MTGQNGVLAVANRGHLEDIFLHTFFHGEVPRVERLQSDRKDRSGE